MRNAFFVFLLFVLNVSSYGSEESDPKKKNSNVSPEPTTYVAAIVVRGDNWKQDSLRAFELQEKHLKFLENLKAQGKLIASGPLTTSPDARGLYVFNVKSIEEARRITATDEAIKSGWIKMKFHIWTSRDYEVTAPNTLESKEDSSESRGGILGLSWETILGGIFALWIIILAFRTFRMKASV